MNRWIATICLAFCHLIVVSQSEYIKGTVINEEQLAVQGASVMLRSVDSGATIITYKITGTNGSFVLDLKGLKPDMYHLEIRHISYQSTTIKINLAQKFPIDLRLMLKARSVELKEVIIRKEPAVVIRSDTIQFNAASFKNAETRKLEDLLRNINGFSVDANGRISFNGKAVEKVLIDGDDLADKGYRLITKNLGAGIVDKVQVIDNYNDNRLMRKVAKSDMVGINIQTVKEKQDHFSGSVTAGLSIEKRYQGEGSLIYLGRPFKLMSFVNTNNIADDPSGTIRYYFAQESGQNDYTSSGGQYTVLSAGSIVPPPLNDRYHKDNSDASLAAMSSWKVGKYTKIKALAGSDRLTIGRNATIAGNTFISDTDTWQVNSVMEEKNSAKDLIAGFSIHRDALKRHVSHIEVDFGSGRQLNRFDNRSSGDLTDTLSEELHNVNRFFRLKWQESFLFRTGKLLRSELFFHQEELVQRFENLSTRFTSLYGVDPRNNLSLQALEGRHFNVEYNLSLLGRQKAWEYQYGLRLFRKISDFSSGIRFSDPKNPALFLDTGNQRMTAKSSAVDFFLHAGRKLSRKTFINTDVALGYGTLYNAALQNSFPRFKAIVSYIWAISAVRSFRLRYSMSSDFGDNFRYFYPFGLISGNGSVLNSIVFNGTTLSSKYSAVYNATNIYRNSQWSATVSLSTGSNQYNPAMTATSDYTISQYLPFDHNFQLFATVSSDRFFAVIKSRLGCSVTYSRYVNTTAVNMETGMSESRNFSFEGRWSTGLTYPVNLETRYNLRHIWGTWRNGPANTNWQFYLQQKLKIKAGSKSYAAVIWNFMQLGGRNSFNGIDLFINYRLNKVWNFAIVGNNLLNRRSVVERSVAPFSTSTTEFNLVRRYVLWRVELQL